MTTVRKLLETKSSDTSYSIASTDTVLQAVKMMTEVSYRRPAGDGG